MSCIVLLGFPKFSLHKFSRIYVRNALLFVVSNNLVYTTSSTTKFRYFLQVFQVERGASMWSSDFLVEVTVRFGVLLAIVRNEARKSPRNPASRSVLKGAFDAKKHLLKNKMHGSIFLRWYEPYCTLHLYSWIYIYSHWSPRKKPQKWTHDAWILPRGISYVTLGLKLPSLSNYLTE